MVAEIPAFLMSVIHALTPAPGQAEAIGQALRARALPPPAAVAALPAEALPPAEAMGRLRVVSAATPQAQAQAQAEAEPGFAPAAPARRCAGGPDRLGNLNYFCR